MCNVWRNLKLALSLHKISFARQSVSKWEWKLRSADNDGCVFSCIVYCVGVTFYIKLIN